MSSQVETAYSFLLSKGYSSDSAWAQANAIHTTAGASQPHARTRSSAFDMSGLGDSLPSARSNTHVPARRSKLDDFGFSSSSGSRAAPSHRYVDEDRYGTGSGYDEYKVREVRPGYSHHSSRVETRDGGYREYSSTTSFSSGVPPAANNDYADDGYGQGRYKVREERPKTRGYSASTFGRGDAYDDEEDDYPRGGTAKSARPSTRHTRRTYDKSYPTTGAGYRDGDWSDGETQTQTRGGAKSSGKYHTREAHPEDYSSARTKYPTRDAHTEEKSGHSSYRTRDAYPEGKHSSSSKSHYEKSHRPKYNWAEPPQAEDEPVNVGVKPPVDLHVVLSVTRSASADELKAAHRKLSLKHHPDRVQGGEAAKKAATEKMAEINRAYDVLKDEKQRGIYDRTGRVHETS